MGHSVAPPRDGVLTRRITVREDSPIAVRTYDYADAFEVRTPEPVLGCELGRVNSIEPIYVERRHHRRPGYRHFLSSLAQRC